MSAYIKKTVAAEDVKAGMVVNAQRGWTVEDVKNIGDDIVVFIPGGEIWFKRGAGHVLSTLVETTIEEALNV
jgi:ribosomal protein L27